MLHIFVAALIAAAKPASDMRANCGDAFNAQLSAYLERDEVKEPSTHPQSLSKARDYYTKSTAIFQRLISEQPSTAAQWRVQIQINQDKIKEIDRNSDHT